MAELKGITKEQEKILLDSYESNKEDLKKVEKHIRNHGLMDNGLSNAEESFEQGWNNALEFAFRTLGIAFS